jgi:RNA polymerase sigma-70 factor (TIGR02943 family)
MKVKAVSPKYDPGRWVDKHGGCLYGYALMRVRMPEVAKDLVQETFLVGIRSREKFAGRSSERSWLAGILKNKILDYFRTAHRETSFTNMEFLAEDGPQSFDAQARWNCLNKPQQWRTEAEEVTHKREFWQTVYDCLSKLPRRHSVVFMLREIDCMSTQETCRTISITEDNLWVMLHRARIALRESLERNWFGRPTTKLVRRQGISRRSNDERPISGKSAQCRNHLAPLTLTSIYLSRCGFGSWTDKPFSCGREPFL